MTTRAAKLAHTVSVGGTFEDGVIQASEVAGISTVAYTGSYTDLLNKPSLSTVATTGSYTDLSNKPTIPSITGLATTASLATVATTGSYTDLSNKPTIPSITGLATTASLSTVATTGSYTDLSNTPTIPSLTGYATQTYVTTAITNLINGAPATLDTLKEISDQLAADESAVAAITTTLAGKANTSSLATVATTGSYTDLLNKPSLGDTLPTQTGNSGKYLQTNGSTVSWQVAATLSAVNTNTSSITADYSISTGTNAQSVGPITQSAGTTLTIAAGQRWLII